MKTYLVEKTNQLLELLSLDEIRILLKIGKLNGHHRIYDDQIGDWVKLSTHSVFLDTNNLIETKVQKAIVVPKDSAMMSTSQTAVVSMPTKSSIELFSAKSASSIVPREWYYLDGQTPVGAFTYLEMIRQIQAKKISASTMVWKQGLGNWIQAKQLKEFHPTEIQQLLKSGIPGIQNYFTRRKFFRFSFAAKFILHNEERLWRGVSFELAPGGLGLLLNSSELEVGQEVFVHKTSKGPGVSINAVAIVRSKSINGMRPGQAKYGLEFVDISRETQLDIAKLQPLQLR